MKAKYTCTLIDLINAINSSQYKTEAIRKLGWEKDGNCYRRFDKLVQFHQIDTSHFVVKRPSWNSGKSHLSLDRIKGTPRSKMFCADSTTKRDYIRQLIIKENLLPYSCSECNISTWRNKKLPLELDHINGINNDHRLENLRFLCANCHSITPTWKRGVSKQVVRK